MRAIRPPGWKSPFTIWGPNRSSAHEPPAPGMSASTSVPGSIPLSRARWSASTMPTMFTAQRIWLHALAI